jgi:hypothetical protein
MFANGRPTIGRCARSLLAATVLIVVSTSAAAGQQVRVALQVTEDTRGIIQSEFASALRRLGDVLIVSEGEAADYALRIVSICLPSRERCDAATNYAVAFSLSQPIPLGVVHGAVAYADSSLVLNESAQNRLWEYFRRFEFPHALWTASWGRDVYRSQISEIVAEIDSRCFERHRLFIRWNQTLRDHGVAEANRLMERALEPRNWLC